MTTSIGPQQQAPGCLTSSLPGGSLLLQPSPFCLPGQHKAQSASGTLPASIMSTTVAAPMKLLVGWYKLMAWLHPQLALCCFLQVHALSADGASLASTCNGTQSTQHQSSKGKQAGQLRCSSRETSHSTQKHSNEHRNAARPCGAPVTVRNSVQQHAAAA